VGQALGLQRPLRPLFGERSSPKLFGGDLTMPPNNPEEPAIVVTTRSYRFSVGERVVAPGLDLLLALVEAAYTANKAGLLQQANTKVNGLRYLLRLAKDLPLTTSH
jgi:hypothetical protein